MIHVMKNTFTHSEWNPEHDGWGWIAARFMIRMVGFLSLLVLVRILWQGPDQLAGLNMRLPADMAIMIGRAKEPETWWGFFRADPAGWLSARP